MTQELTTLPDTKQIELKVEDALSHANGLTIKDAETFKAGAAFLLGLKSILKEVAETFDPVVAAAFKAHKAAKAAKDKHSDPLIQAERIVKSKLSVFQVEEATRQREAQRKAQEAARKLEEERALQDAIDLESSGQKAEAEALLAQPVDVPVVHVESGAKAQGVSTRKAYGAVCHDLLALVKHVAAHPEYINLLQENGPALNSMARSLKDAMKIPGVEVVVENIVSAKVG